MELPTQKEDEDDALILIEHWSGSKRLIILQQLYRVCGVSISDIPYEILKARKIEAKREQQ